jgi:hypothetical protein
MRLDSRILAAISAITSLVILHCGASSPQPASVGPASGASASSASSSAAPPAGNAPASGTSSAAADKAAPAEPAAASGPSPRDVLARPGVLYTVAFEECDAGKKAVETCSKESGTDPKKRAACMAKAREKVDFEGMQFAEEKDGSWWWLTLRRKGNSLTTLHKVRFQFGDEKNGAITLKTEGGGAKVPASVSFEVPSDFRIVTNDPKYGRIVLDAKMIGTGKN